VRLVDPASLTGELATTLGAYGTKDKVFSLSAGGAWVVSGVVASHEDEGSDSDPSHFDVPRIVWQWRPSCRLGPGAPSTQPPLRWQWGWGNQSPTRWRDPSGNCPACLGAELGFFAGAIYYTATADINQSAADFFAGAFGAGLQGALDGALLASGAAIAPRATFLFIGATQVSSENDLWKLGLAAPLADGGGEVVCPSETGSLTPSETKALQGIADKYQTQIDVVGSRAAGEGRNIDTDLPVGKGEGTRSDIDVRIDGQVDIDSGGALSNDISNLSGGAGSIVSAGGYPSTGPTIIFRPGLPPKVVK
jgi:hypothetical protein